MDCVHHTVAPTRLSLLADLVAKDADLAAKDATIASERILRDQLTEENAALNRMASALVVLRDVEKKRRRTD
jgi:hypothetical protein